MWSYVVLLGSYRVLWGPMGSYGGLCGAICALCKKSYLASSIVESHVIVGAVGALDVRGAIESGDVLHREVGEGQGHLFTTRGCHQVVANLRCRIGA